MAMVLGWAHMGVMARYPHNSGHIVYIANYQLIMNYKSTKYTSLSIFLSSLCLFEKCQVKTYTFGCSQIKEKVQCCRSNAYLQRTHPLLSQLRVSYWCGNPGLMIPVCRLCKVTKSLTRYNTIPSSMLWDTDEGARRWSGACCNPLTFTLCPTLYHHKDNSRRQPKSLTMRSLHKGDLRGCGWSASWLAMLSPKSQLSSWQDRHNWTMRATAITVQFCSVQLKPHWPTVYTERIQESSKFIYIVVMTQFIIQLQEEWQSGSSVTKWMMPSS